MLVKNMATLCDYRTLTPRGWMEKLSVQQINEMVETTRLLTKREMQKLFPDCEIHTERFLGFTPKSYIAFRKAADISPA